MEILIPYATLEPIRDLLLQGCVGEKFGHDTIWESHLATEIRQTAIPVEAVVEEMTLPLREIMDLKVGQTIMLNTGPDDPVHLRCSGIPLTDGTMGRLGDNVAVRVLHSIGNRREAGVAGGGAKRDGTEAGQQ